MDFGRIDHHHLTIVSHYDLFWQGIDERFRRELAKDRYEILVRFESVGF